MMSDDGLLSQDDIDALTASLMGGDDDGDLGLDLGGGDLGGDDNSGDDFGDGGSGGMDPENLRAFIKTVSEQAASVITTVISRNVEFKIDAMEMGSSELFQDFGSVDEIVGVRVQFENGINGGFQFLVSRPATAMLADLMMMGDGTAGFEEDHKDALAEIINQVMGALNTHLSEEQGLGLSISQAEVTDFASAAAGFELESSVVAKTAMKVEDIPDHPVLFVAEGELANSWNEVINGAGATPSAPEVAPEMAETPEIMIPEEDSPAPAPGLATPAQGGSRLFDSTGNRALDMLLDVPLNVTIELGRAEMSIRKILEIGPGSVVEMDHLAGEPVDLLINNKVVARGEVVVVEENFGIRVVSLVTPEERLKFLK